MMRLYKRINMLANDSLDSFMVGKILGEHNPVKSGVTRAITKEMVIGLVLQGELEQFLIFFELIQEGHPWPDLIIHIEVTYKI
jgi:hypothetical protein